jgi:hypothetical protein
MSITVVAGLFASPRGPAQARDGVLKNVQILAIFWGIDPSPLIHSRKQSDEQRSAGDWKN